MGVSTLTGEAIALFNAWKRALHRRMLVRVYHLAVAQEQGQVVRGRLTRSADLTAQEQVSTIVSSLAKLEGGKQAARLLGLTAGELVDHRERAAQVNMRRALSHLREHRDRLMKDDDMRLPGCLS
jgi:hypothetical protein